MITTNDNDLAEKLRQLRDHGAAISDRQRHLGAKPYLLADHLSAGYNQRMTDIQAVLGSAQMERADQILQARRQLASKLNQKLSGLEWLSLPTEPEGRRHSYQSYPCLYEPVETKRAVKARDHRALLSIGEERNRWMDALYQSGISTRPATHAVHTLSYFSQKYHLHPIDFPSAFAAHSCSIAFPFFLGMTEDEVEYMVQTIRVREA